MSILEIFLTNNRRYKNIMATLDQLLKAVENEDTKIEGLITLVKGLREEIKKIGKLTPEQQAAVDKLFDDAIAQADSIQKALDNNTEE